MCYYDEMSIEVVILTLTGDVEIDNCLRETFWDAVSSYPRGNVIIMKSLRILFIKIEMPEESLEKHRAGGKRWENFYVDVQVKLSNQA